MASARSVGLRAAKARQTRLRIVRAAHDLFVAHGFEGTRIQDVAKAAGVAVQTVYNTFQTKTGLLAEVEEFVVLGDRTDHEWRDAPWVHLLDEARTADVLLARFVAIDTDIKARLAPFVLAVGPHLPDDGTSHVLRAKGQDEFFGYFLSRLQALQPLRPGLSTQRALDILRVINTLGNYLDLTTNRAWTAKQWRDWLKDLLTQQLIA